MAKPTCTKKGGGCLAFPDTCHIPAPPPPAGPGGIPTPFPNKTSCSDSTDTTEKVFFQKKEVVIDGSKVPSSMGDEPGCSNLPTPKGLMSQTNTGKMAYKDPSSKVKAEGKGLICLGATTEHNGSGNKNAKLGKQCIPSQTKVLNN
jgi:hypothetical protein